MNAMMAQSNINDYKALVCIFLAGGNDSNNLIIPTIQSEYDSYSTLRGANLAIPLSGGPFNVLPISPLNSDGHGYGFHPSCPEMVTLFNEGKLAPLFNTGTLLYPTTKAQYANVLLRPPQLFSHADQVTQWQTSVPDQAPLTGWGGRCADLLASVQPTAPISLTVTLSGANTFEVGNIVSEYSVSTTGAIAMTLPSSPTSRLQAMTNILALPYPNLQTKAYADVAQHAIATGAQLTAAIAPTLNTSLWNWTPQFPGTVVQPTAGTSFTSNNLGPQLKMIARLIEAGHRAANASPVPGFGMKRQIFFCQVGGYDLHSGQTSGSTPATVVTGAHANLFAELSQCMYAFQRAMEKIGVNHSDPDFASRVTTFTSSDFGRTFPTNTVGTDHGWGSHHLIMGGAVRGQRTYGKWPTLAINGPDDTNTGRWIPTTAVDQYFATLASWFGIDNSNLSTVFPNLGRFATSNLGFI
jgi:uncharacterized protein (DUF1501 family)